VIIVDILGKARTLESTIARQFDNAARKLASSGAREPLEIVHAIVDAVDREVQPGGRGRRIFPFNSIRVSLVTPTREARDRFEAILAGDSGLRRRITDRLHSSGCATPDVTVDVSYVARPQKNWRNPEFDVRFARIEEPVVLDVPPSGAARLDVTVVRGVAEKRTYSFATDRIDLGRGGEVKDTRSRLIRSNHVVFVEGGGDINQSVSRQHAHIVCRSGSGEFRLYDDGSAQGTLIVRQGTTIAVFRGSRGVRLNSGDEIVLGEARLKVRISADRSG
jgi:hypothetical protein